MKLEDVKIVRVSAAAAAGTSTVNGTAVDMTGYDGVLFFASIGAIVSGAATSLKAQQGAASNGSDAADLAGTSVVIADTDDDKVAVLEVYRPSGRYVRPVLLRATQNATLDGIIAVLYSGHKRAVALDTSAVSTSKAVASPALGTP